MLNEKQKDGIFEIGEGDVLVVLADLPSACVDDQIVNAVNRQCRDFLPLVDVVASHKGFSTTY